jgi:hypothetical protein
MRVIALGAYRMSGVSKKSGAPYEMAKLITRAPLDTFSSSTMSRVGYGFSVNELDIELVSFSKFNLSYPIGNYSGTWHASC